MTVNRTYALNPEVVERLNATARRLSLRQSELVDFLLDQALDQVETGSLIVPTTPKVYGIVHHANGAA
jgi:hypothetical protein